LLSATVEASSFPIPALCFDAVGERESDGRGRERERERATIERKQSGRIDREDRERGIVAPMRAAEDQRWPVADGGLSETGK